MLRRRQRARRGVVLGALGVAVATAPAASGAETFGSNLNSPAVGFISVTTTTATAANESLPAGARAPGGFTSPIDGIVVRWRIKVGAPDTGPVALQLTRPGDSNTRTSVATSATVTPPLNATTEYPTQLPVQAGDALALGFPDGTRLYVLAQTVGANLLAWDPRLQDGEPPRAGVPFGTDFELLINADVEPDCDSDGLGDETQDPEVPPGGPCPRGGRTIALDASKNKVKKGKKVVLSGRIMETRQNGACAANQAIQLQRKRASQSSFTTFEQLQTDAAGGFSAKQKVKKTFEYRAEAGESATCAAGLSNTEKVKAKKK